MFGVIYDVAQPYIIMGPVSIYPVLPIILIALFTIMLVSKIIKITPLAVRNESIDGVRGYLAFFVFLHHSAIWYYYLRTNNWSNPPSNLYSHFGSTSVDLFFMITSFLFFSKLIEAKEGYIDWLKLYVSRILRIVPLYTFAVFVLVIIVAVLSQFILKEPLGKLFVEIAKWFLYLPVDINGVQPTRLIVAGVIWTLEYEWMFYCSLAIFGLLIFKIRTSLVTILLTGFFFIFFTYLILRFTSFNFLERVIPFLGGIAAAILSRKERIRLLASGRMASICILFLLPILVVFFSSADTPVPFLIISIIFIAIACGNSLFGVLTSNISRTLGQISYSVYLLHGIILFIAFRFIVGIPKARVISPMIHWGIVCACSVFVVIICSLTYKYIELPAMKAASRVTGKLRNYLGGYKKAPAVRLEN